MTRLLYILIVVTGCREVYNPPIKIINSGYLVVEGNIVAGNDSTFIHLSRTIPVADTSIVQPEINATVKVESEDGETYQLKNENNGIYQAPSLNINASKKYRLHIFTANGTEYASDYVPVKISPPIDSVSWKFDQTGGINIYVSTHDETNNTQYYKWNFTETWEHRAFDSSQLIFENGVLRNRLPSEGIYRCWNANTANDILLASTTALSSDVVFEKKLFNIPFESSKVRWVYSMLVTQQPLTKDGFEFWDNLKKNTEQIGTIFDPQPSDAFGNIHCISNPGEIVIGFISACSISQQRLYIVYSQVHYPYVLQDCQPITIGNAFAYIYFSGSIVAGFVWVPFRYGDAPGTVLAYPVECLDCRVQGGTNIRPPYMP